MHMHFTHFLENIYLYISWSQALHEEQTCAASYDFQINRQFIKKTNCKLIIYDVTKVSVCTFKG